MLFCTAVSQRNASFRPDKKSFAHATDNVQLFTVMYAFREIVVLAKTDSVQYTIQLRPECLKSNLFF